ncbi:MAG TPA: sigma-70 family RNA polymerase sigma factor [Candidatus Uhrbacteria bacterium]|nr:sigma-70 family RNA polymerase sigma factor [Candidatus Uhrbacteria bacterium]
MKEIRIEARVRNNILYHAIFDTWGSVRQFCLVYKLNELEVGKLLNLTKSPVTKKGKWRPFCLKLAEILGKEVEALFPLQLYEVEMPKRTIELSFAELPLDGIQQIKQLPTADDPEINLISGEKRQEFLQVIKDLTPREEKVILMYFGLDEDGKEYTLKQIADDFGVGPERIRQIKEKALHKLRHVTRSKKIFEALT